MNSVLNYSIVNLASQMGALGVMNHRTLITVIFAKKMGLVLNLFRHAWAPGMSQ